MKLGFYMSIVCLGLVVQISPLAAQDQAEDKCFVKPEVMALKSKPEDITLSYKALPGDTLIPTKVRDYIDTLSWDVFKTFDKFLKKTDGGVPAENGCFYELKQTYGTIFYVPLEGDIDLYLFHAKGVLRIGWLHIIVFNSQTESILNEPLDIYAKWQGIFTEDEAGPLVSLVDLDGFGHKEIRLRKTLHIGNMYNALAHHYISYDQASANRILVNEFLSQPDNYELKRQVEILSPTSARIMVQGTHMETNESVESIIDLKRKNTKSPFQLAIQPKTGQILNITGCEIDPNVFLAHGCNFRY